MAKIRIKPQHFQSFDKNIVNVNEEFEVLKQEFSEISELYNQTSNTYKVNKIVSGKILEKTSDGLKIDINYKSNGFIPAHEFSSIELRDLKDGDSLEVMIEELENADGIVALSYEKAKSTRQWEKIVYMYKENKPVEGIVTSKVQGGLCVDIGIIVFLPGSQIDIQRVTDFDQWIGKKIQAYIIKLMPKRGNVVISRRKYIHEQRSEARKDILDTLSEGQIISGLVKNITRYGAFVDVGGVDGLLHITDMTWSRIDDPTELIKIGETITVKILSFDKENEKISLGIKQLLDNPWEKLTENINIGSIVKGTLISIKDYGIFIEIMKGVEGLVHISEISWTNRITDLNKHFKIGQEIEASVVSIERKNRRMSLSIKQMEKNPWETIVEEYKIGQKIKGMITNIADFGFFVQIANGIDGLVHISDISWTQHVKHPSDIFKKGDAIEAIIIDINIAKKKISLSIKDLAENPWKTIIEKLPIGTFVSGEIIKIVEFGAFVKLKDLQIEAFIHISECSDTPNALIENSIKVGSEYSFKVIRVSPEEQKIGLSLRKNDYKKSGGSPYSSNSSGKYQKDSNNNSNNNNNNNNKFSSNNNKEKSNNFDHKSPSRQSSFSNQQNNQSSSSSSSGNEKRKSSMQIEMEKMMNNQNPDENKNIDKKQGDGNEQ